MGIWDRSEALSYPRLTDTFEQDRPFVLLAMRLTTPIEIPGSDLGPTPVVILTCRGAQSETGESWRAYGEPVELGIISGPIQDLAENATDDDFPVVVKWSKVKPKDSTRAEATVLALVSRDVTVA